MSFEGTFDQFPEAAKSREALLARAKELPWYHAFPLGDGFTAPGLFDLTEYVPYYLLPAALRGLSCLEVGTANGFWSFQMEQRGAGRVLATDIKDYNNTDLSRTPATPPAPPAPEGSFHEPFRIAACLRRSRVEFGYCSVYDLAPAPVGTFDLVFCGSMLMHLFGPLVALQRMADVCKNTLLLTTETELTLDGSNLVQYRGQQLSYVHFVPAPSALVQMLQSCGYEQVVRGPTFYVDHRDRVRHPHRVCHTACVGLKDAARPCIDLPPPGPVAAAHRQAAVEVLSAPARAMPGQSCEIYVRVKNDSPAAWRGEGEATGLQLGYEIQHVSASGKASGWGPAVVSPLPFLDYLPAGLASMARLVIPIPEGPQKVRIRPVVLQQGGRFRSNEACAEVAVGPGFASGVVRKMFRRVAHSFPMRVPRQLVSKFRK
jgi:2-polyprenyl-3-methyl-5-hydroxy-6-metoxy-1,4-benzoquinol methylase